MYCQPPAIRSTVHTCFALFKLSSKTVSTSCSNHGNDNNFQADTSAQQSRVVENAQPYEHSSDRLATSTNSEPLFLRQLSMALRDVETTIGISQRSLQDVLQKSMPLLKPSMISETFNEAKSSNTKTGPSSDNHQKKCSLNLIQSMQLKMALSSLETNSPNPFGGLTQSLEKFQKLIDDEQQLYLENEPTDCDDMSMANEFPLRSFHSIRPKESFLSLIVAHLMNPQLSTADNDSKPHDPIRRHLFMLLNIIQMTRKGSRSRIDVDHNATSPASSAQTPADINVKGKSSSSPGGLANSPPSLPPSTSSSSSFPSMEPYRWSILKGNFYYYNVTYSLMRLNMSNVSQLMGAALQDMTGIQFWLEREARQQITACHPQAPASCLQLSGAVRRQLAAGQLMAVWASVLAAQQATLLANGCQSVAYLLGKDAGQAPFTAAGQLGHVLTHLFALIEDYWTLKLGGKAAVANHTTEHWSAVRHLHFFLRLPVLLYLKEASSSERSHRFKLAPTETDCQQLVRNVSVFNHLL